MAFEVQRQQLAAGEALADVVLCRRTLLRWRQAAWELRGWREAKCHLEARGREALARWALRRLQRAAQQRRGLLALRLRSDRDTKRRALRRWRALVVEQRCVRLWDVLAWVLTVCSHCLPRSAAVAPIMAGRSAL